MIAAQELMTSTHLVTACDEFERLERYWRRRAAAGEAQHAHLMQVFYVLTLLLNPRLAVP